MDNAPTPSAETRKRHLHDGRPFWAATPDISVPALARPGARSYAVVIVGAGISGALGGRGAEPAVQAGADPGPAGAGAGIDPGLDRDDPARDRHAADPAGGDDRRGCGGSGLASVGRGGDAAGGVVEASEAGPDMVPKKTLYLTGDDMGARAMEAEPAAAGAGADRGLAERAGAAGAVRDRADRGDRVDGLGLGRIQAQLAAGLLRVAQARGAEVVSPTEVTDFVEVGDHVALGTAEGRVILAEHAVLHHGISVPARDASRGLTGYARPGRWRAGPGSRGRTGWMSSWSGRRRTRTSTSAAHRAGDHRGGRG